MSKLIFSRSDLIAATKRAARAVCKKNIRAILAGVSVMAADGRANLLCTDLETYSSASLDVSGDGHFCVDASKFKSMLDCLIGDMVEIDVETSQITMRDEKSRLSLRQFTDPFPEEKFTDGAPSFECDGGSFAAAMSFVEPSVGGAHKSYVFGAICLRVKEGVIECWGMDGAMFAGAFTKGTVHRQVECSLVPPAFSTLIAGITGDMECWLNKSSIAIRTPEDFVMTRLVEGKYPDLQGLLAKQHTTKGQFACKAGELRKALQAAKVVCTGDAVAVEMLLNSPTVLEVRAPNKEPGEVETKVFGVLTGEQDAATFDVERAIVGIGCFGGDVVVKSSGPEAPWVVESAAEEGQKPARVISFQPNIAKVQAKEG